MKFDSGILSHNDWKLADSILGGPIGTGIHREPDLVIGEDDVAYLYRWHLVHSDLANIYFHIQTSSDPQRPEHDHPWDNTSVILSGGYDELWNQVPWLTHDHTMTRKLRKGDVVHRTASEAHRLLLPSEFRYTMTLFSTGPKVREWGFWFPQGWRSHDDVLAMEHGMSTFTQEAKADE
jgi:hypothetical protein